MESSSNDSFLWTDASNNSVNMSSGSNTAQSEGDDPSETRKEQKICSSFLDNNNKITNQNNREPKKRKQPASSDESPPKKKRIKLEPESDIEKGKQRKLGKAMNETNYESHSSGLSDEAYLNLLVKKEEESCISPEIVKLKKSKKRKKPSVDNLCETQFIPDLDKNGDIDVEMEVKPDLQVSDSETNDYLNLRVKQEQASVANATLITKNKKRKKRKRSASPSNENATSSKYMELNETAIENNSSPCGEQTYVPCSVIVDKFSAEESEVEKPTKKKRKKDACNIVCKESSDNIKIVPREVSDDNSCNGTSFQPNDFTCNNVVSSTVINDSMGDRLYDSKNHITDTISSDLLTRDNDLQTMTSISDRIRFEDDDTKTPQELVSRRISSKLTTFLKANPHLRILSKTQNNCLVTEDDDIWIIRCPNDMNLKELKNNYLSIEGKCKTKINGQTYNAVLNDDESRVTVVTYQNGQVSLTNLPIKGCLNYRKRIPKTHIPDNISMVNNQTNFIPLPDTKCRHPLFGSDYKKSLKIPAVVKERLQAAKERPEVSCENVINKRSKKHRKRVIDINIDQEFESEIEILKKKKKCKPSQDTPPVAKKTKKKCKPSQDTPPAAKKKKSIKHERAHPEAWDSEQAIEENLFNF